ncbi:cation-transporting ATPase [Kineococcus sp. SYSU DK018]|uniref:cation-transporting ATPase n=1 Tax=Kineococcus sp. SYSU DK018 TaxID=3383139 RepID=UPI003D7E9375
MTTTEHAVSSAAHGRCAGVVTAGVTGTPDVTGARGDAGAARATVQRGRPARTPGRWSR